MTILRVVHYPRIYCLWTQKAQVFSTKPSKEVDARATVLKMGGRVRESDCSAF